jgi:hypothetical protein
MQSNGQSANTTSVPIAKAKNPPPTKGDAVRVARWSRNPNSVSMTALKVGTLGIINNCLVMNNKGPNLTGDHRTASLKTAVEFCVTCGGSVFGRAEAHHFLYPCAWSCAWCAPQGYGFAGAVFG